MRELDLTLINILSQSRVWEQACHVGEQIETEIFSGWVTLCLLDLFGPSSRMCTQHRKSPGDVQRVVYLQFWWHSWVALLSFGAMLPPLPSRPQVSFVSFLAFSPFMASGSIVSIVSMVSFKSQRSYEKTDSLWPPCVFRQTQFLPSELVKHSCKRRPLKNPDHSPLKGIRPVLLYWALGYD